MSKQGYVLMIQLRHIIQPRFVLFCFKIESVDLTELINQQ